MAKTDPPPWDDGLRGDGALGVALKEAEELLDELDEIGSLRSIHLTSREMLALRVVLNAAKDTKSQLGARPKKKGPLG